MHASPCPTHPACLLCAPTSTGLGVHPQIGAGGQKKGSPAAPCTLRVLLTHATGGSGTSNLNEIASCVSLYTAIRVCVRVSPLNVVCALCHTHRGAAATGYMLANALLGAFSERCL